MSNNYATIYNLGNHPNAVNHPVKFMDGTTQWVKMSPNEKRYYSKLSAAMYCEFLNQNANASE
jgi:hypothetical protein